MKVSRKYLVLLAVLIASISIALGANDPGHDSLYIEENGDSELNGTFNITGNETVKGGEVEIGTNFKVRGDGNLPASNINYIVGDYDNFISINSLGNGEVLRLQDQVVGGLVQIGTQSTNLVDLNVSNDVYILGNYLGVDSNFELRTDGTFPSADINTIVVNGTGSNRKMWLTANDIYLARGIATGMVYLGDGGSDSVALNVTGDLIVQGSSATVNGGNICTDTNGLCSSGSSTGGGWTNTSTTTSTSYNVNVDSGDLFVNTTSGHVGIGTAVPENELHVDGDITVGNGDNNGDIHIKGSGGTHHIELNSFGDSYFRFSGGGGLGLSDTDPDFKLEVANNYSLGYFGISTSASADGNIFIINPNGSVGIGLTNPGVKLHVNGSINVTAGNDICINGGNCLSSIGEGSGNITGSGTSNTIAKFTAAGTIGDSIITDNGSLVNISGTLQTNEIIFGATSDSIHIGADAGNSNSGDYATLVGTQAGYENTGDFVTTLGRSAGYQNTGDFLTSIGQSSGYQNSAHYSTIIGRKAGQFNTGIGLTAVGYEAGDENTGNYTTTIGYFAGEENKGYRIVSIGYEAANNNSGNDTIAIGYQAGKDNTQNNQLIIQQANINNIPLIQGDFSNAYLGINTTTPTQALHVTGNTNITGNAWVNGGQVCTSTNGLCSGGSGSGGGWSNTSTTTSTNLNVNASGNLWVNTTSGRVGIGTTAPEDALHIVTAAASENVIFESSDSVRYATIHGGNTDSNPIGQFNVYNGGGFHGRFGAGTNGVILRGDDRITFHIDSTTVGIIDESGQFGLGFASESSIGERLHVNGSINVTAGNDICIEGGNCLSSVSGGSGNGGGWSNTSTTTSTSLNVNVTGNVTPSANNTYSLGTPDLVWKDVYVGANSLHIGGLSLSVSGGSLLWNGVEVLTSGSGAAAGWNDTGTMIELLSSTDNINMNTLYVNNSAGTIGIGTAESTGTLFIDGASDRNQLLIQGTSSIQSSDIFLVENGTGTDLLSVQGDGDTYVKGNLGVQKTAPSTTVDVNGTLNVTASDGSGIEVSGDGNVIIRLG